MQNRTKGRLAAVVAMAGLLLAAAIGFAEKSKGASDADDQAQQQKPNEAPRLDVAFAIDATGSMQDEIDVIKKEVWSIANEIASGQPTPDVRFGLVFYRDRGDKYVVRKTEMTRNIDAIHEKLMAADAGGGGDHREHVIKALDTALDLEWESGDDVSRTLYLVGDAPAHTDYDEQVTLSSVLSEAKQRNIKVNTIGCSGINSQNGKQQFASISKKTSGKYKALTYHAVVKNEQGQETSVVYQDGKYYESDEKLSDEEWSRGADKLLEGGKLEPAAGETARKAERSKDKKNNLDRVVEDEIKSSASDMGVAY